MNDLRKIRLISLGAALFLMWGVGFASDVNNTQSSVVTVPHGDHIPRGSNAPDCRASDLDGQRKQGTNFSMCGSPTISLPPGAQVTEIHYFIKNDKGVFQEVPANRDLRYALMTPAAILYDPQTAVVTVTATLKNWSESDSRETYIVVGWHKAN